MLNENVAKDLFREIIFDKFNENTLMNGVFPQTENHDVDLICYIFKENIAHHEGLC